MQQVAVLLAGGHSQRLLKNHQLDQFIDVYQNVQLYEFVLNTLLKSFLFSRIYVVIPEHKLHELRAKWEGQKTLKFMVAATTRYGSSLQVVKEIADTYSREPNTFVSFIDATRPLIRKLTLFNVMKQALITGAASAAVPVNNVIGISNKKTLEQTLASQVCYQLQTPQTFKLELLVALLAKPTNEIFEDLTSAVLTLKSAKISLVTGDPTSFKIYNHYDYVRLIDELKRSK